jgi:hypothetical protein
MEEMGIDDGRKVVGATNSTSVMCANIVTSMDVVEPSTVLYVPIFSIVIVPGVYNVSVTGR